MVRFQAWPVFFQNLSSCLMAIHAIDGAGSPPFCRPDWRGPLVFVFVGS